MSDKSSQSFEDICKKYMDLTQKYEKLTMEHELLQKEYAELRANEEMYRVAIGMTDHTITVVDIKNRTLNQIYNEGDWTGIAVSMENAPESIISTGIIHPEDCDGYRDFYRKIYSGVPKGEFTMRVMEENRGWVWFTMYYTTVFNGDGEPMRAICFSDDVTIEKMAEDKYIQYKNAVTTDADYVWELNLTQNKILSTSGAFSNIFGLDNITKVSELTQMALLSIPDSGDAENAEETFSRKGLIKAFKEAKREVSAEYRFDPKDGSGVRWHHATAYLMTNLVSDIIAILSINDITERHLIQENLERKAERDSLTGLYNRYAFETRMAGTLSRERDQVHGYLIMDVDDFKHFNDTYGHAFGDSVLNLVADVLSNSFRINDVVGRVGGDEFMVFMRGMNSVELLEERAQNLRDQLKKACAEKNTPKPVTLSIGGALSKPGDNFEKLYYRADKALYKSKDKGKDCFTLYDE